MAGPETVADTHGMITGMKPVLTPDAYCFCTVTADDPRLAQLVTRAHATFREAEGMSLILTADDAAGHGFDTDQAMRQISLNVYSSLEGVGLTAAVATALADAGIACNMVAAYYHDHAFVPADDAVRALDILQDLSQGPQS